MLDLNLNVFSSNSTSDGTQTMTQKLLELSGNQMEDSGSFNSSIVNADASSNTADDDSCSTHPNRDYTNTFAYNFDILKSTDGCTSPNAANDGHRTIGSGSVTRQLFPAMGGGNGLVVGGPSSGSFLENQYMGLVRKEGEYGGSAEQRISPQQQRQQQGKKSRRGPRSRSSQYRGVTFYRRTGRWESHIWDCGKQVYLGGFDTAHSAARAYDRAAIKFRGVDADINFNISDYDDDIKQMNNLTKEEFVHILRRQSTGFSRGSSKYRGVTLHKCGRWEARMGQFLGKKYIYLGLFESEVEAARF
ncbi:hypothetical protein L1049_008212 [Liquidambar formosana]|uniref:AP2/ERF domain-containing protein n=1 Tax=Liquidambar formosana TaxID=63359 RepID=A0AAP0X854_LIQFO